MGMQQLSKSWTKLYIVESEFKYYCMEQNSEVKSTHHDLTESFPVPFLGGQHSSVQVCLIYNKRYW
jgi:hypothetical protein